MVYANAILSLIYICGFSKKWNKKGMCVYAFVYLCQYLRSLIVVQTQPTGYTLEHGKYTHMKGKLTKLVSLS